VEECRDALSGHCCLEGNIETVQHGAGDLCEHGFNQARVLVMEDQLGKPSPEATPPAREDAGAGRFPNTAKTAKYQEEKLLGEVGDPIDAVSFAFLQAPAASLRRHGLGR
jgi:hypothetical protein